LSYKVFKILTSFYYLVNPADNYINFEFKKL
jgi:hypothetical protein